jgi:hypothetical protein
MRAFSGVNLRASSNATVGSSYINGSHHIYGKSGSNVRLSIPIHGNRPIKFGLLRHLCKAAEIFDKELD